MCAVRPCRPTRLVRTFFTAIKAKKLAGQFEHRSVLDDIVVRGTATDPVLPELVQQHGRNSAFWRGLGHPVNPRDREA
jgi:hypothetical protein